MNQLFSTNKVGVFFDGYAPVNEKRRGGEVTCLQVKLRVEPFDAKLAASLDDGVGGDSNIKATIFSLSTGDPKPNFTRHDFKLGLPRQTLEIYATPDTDTCRIALAQAKITGTYVRGEKDSNALGLVLKATFGPVGRDELELIHMLHRQQAWINFVESEPLLDEEADDDGDDDEDAETDADEKARRPAPMWDDQQPVLQADDEVDGDDEETPSKKATRATKRTKGVNRKLHSHQSKKKAATKAKAKKKR